MGSGKEDTASRPRVTDVTKTNKNPTYRGESSLEAPQGGLCSAVINKNVQGHFIKE